MSWSAVWSGRSWLLRCASPAWRCCFAPLPILFALPAVQDFRILGVPLDWWVLGVAVYPVLYLLARLHRRQAERIERDFTDLLGRG